MCIRDSYYSYGDAVYAFSRRNDGNGNEIICLFNNSASPQTRTITLNPGTTSFTIGTQLTDLLDTDTVINVKEGTVENSRIITVTLPANGSMMLTSGYPAEYHQPTYSQTKIIVHYDTGFGNSLTIRGSEAPLNWDSGLKCENVNDNTWQFVIERPLPQSLEFKVLLNDTTWESGNNHVVQNGGTVEIWPNF